MVAAVVRRYMIPLRCVVRRIERGARLCQRALGKSIGDLADG